MPGTYYLYAYGKNSESGSIAHAGYTITAARVDVTLSFGATTSFDVETDEDFTEPTLTVTPNVPAITSNIEYSISNSGSNATINENTGEVSLGTQTGTATVTASFEGDATYKSAEVSYTINITEAPLRTVKISTEAIDFDSQSYSAPITNVETAGYEANDAEGYDIKFKGAFNFSLSSETAIQENCIPSQFGINEWRKKQVS